MAAAGAFLVSATPVSASSLARRFAANAGSKTIVDHAAWTGLINAYSVVSSDGIVRVRYGDWKRSGRSELSTYLEHLQSVNVGGLSRREQFAYWVNLYNAKTIDIVLDRYPVASIRDIGLGGGLFTHGPWKKKLVTVDGVDLSLDDIEHEILRPTFRDPRIHYVVNCASIGCPNLPRKALTGGAADGVLNAAAVDYINHPRGVSVRNGRITASKIYDWYAEDFGGRRQLPAHWKRYAKKLLTNKLNQASGIADFRYDWRLNDVG